MKTFKLLIAYDGSECSKEALQGLHGSGLPKNTEAVILTVADTWIPADPPIQPMVQNWLTENIAQSEERKRRLLDQAKQTAWSAVEVLRTRFPSWTLRAEAKADSPAWGIVKYADQWQPDLIVMGSHCRSGLGRFFLGSVSQQVLIHVRSSIRIIHPDISLGRPPRFLIGFDGSADAQRVIRRVAERPWPRGTQIRLVSVFDQKMAHWVEASICHQRSGHTSKGRKEFWEKQVMRPALLALKKAGLHVEPVFREGLPATVLIREAERWHADCIFLGARGLIAIERFLLGSVSTQITAKAPCTVEVVR